MEAQSDVKPDMYDIYVDGEDAIVVIRDYIEEISEEISEETSEEISEEISEEKQVRYIWNEYSLRVPNSDFLEDSITNNFDAWLKKARGE